MKISFSWALVVAATLLLAFAPAQAESVVVIVNKDNANVVDKLYITRIYTGAIRGWPDGSPTFPVDQMEDSAARAAFYDTIVGKSQATMRAIWLQNIFSGNGLPPKIASPDAAVKLLVVNNRNAIGYILASQVDSTVRVIAK